MISYPLQGLHNLMYENVNPTMVNGYGIVSSIIDMEYNKSLDRRRPCFEDKLTE